MNDPLLFSRTLVAGSVAGMELASWAVVHPAIRRLSTSTKCTPMLALTLAGSMPATDSPRHESRENAMNAWRLTYTAALHDGDPDRIVAQLAEDVVIRVAVHNAPMCGRELARFLFGVLAEELGAIRPTGEIMETNRAVVLFDTSIGDQAAQGLNVLAFDDAGLISDLTVFFRPLGALGAIAEAVGARMQAQFGPPPA